MAETRDDLQEVDPLKINDSSLPKYSEHVPSVHRAWSRAEALEPSLNSRLVGGEIPRAGEGSAAKV